MRYVILLSMMLPATALPESDPSPKARSSASKAQCTRPELKQAEGKAPTVGLHKLGDLPPARALYTVVRQIDGCPIPVSVPAR